MNGIRRLLKSSLIYFVGNILSSLVTFILLPIYTKYLYPAEYGYYDLIKTITTLVVSVAFIQIQTIVLRFMYDYVGKEKEKAVTNAGIIFIISMIITSIVLSVLSFFVEIKYFPLVLLFAYSECFQSFYGYVTRGYGRNMLFAISGLVATVVNAVLNVLLIVVFHCDYSALYIAMILSVLAQCLVIEVNQGIIRRFKMEYIDWTMMKKMIYFGIPFSLNIGAYWLLNSYSRLIISNKLGVEQNGIYAIATKFTLILNLVSTCFMMAWQELAFEKGASKEETVESLGVFYTNAGNMYLEALYIGTLLLLPIIRIIYPVFIGDRYADGISIIPLAIIATLINIYCSFQTSIFSSIKKNAPMFWATVGGALINVVLVNIFIIQYELLAVNLSLIAGFMVNALIRGIVLNRQLGVKYDVYGLLKFIPIFVLTYYIYNKCSLYINGIWLLLIIILYTVKNRKLLVEVILSAKNYKLNKIKMKGTQR